MLTVGGQILSLRLCPERDSIALFDVNEHQTGICGRKLLPAHGGKRNCRCLVMLQAQVYKRLPNTLHTYTSSMTTPLHQHGRPFLFKCLHSLEYDWY